MTDEQSEFVMRHAGGPPGPAGARGVKGERGPKGDKGDKGVRGLTSKTAQAIVFLFLLAFVTAGFSLLLTVHYVNAYQASQRRQGEMIERAICTDIGTMAAIPAPTGNPAANPSRAYEQAESRAWSGLYVGLGCRR
jgi:hypothetical protein